MSANPTRFDGRATTADPGSPLQEGNRVLESIARQEALRALLAFSDLHEQIRNRRNSFENGIDRDLFETERFILDEVLQLICDRAQAITGADGIVIALIEGSAVVCRASSGALALPRGVPLRSESWFLRDCLELGNIHRCDDCKADPRVQLDSACDLNAQSTVAVPLRGRRQPLGVMQAFSLRPRAFTDHDIRCFDLLAELVLSALKPEDQDRRVGWLSYVADEVLHGKPASATVADADAYNNDNDAATDDSESGKLADDLPAIDLLENDLPSINDVHVDVDDDDNHKANEDDRHEDRQPAVHPRPVAVPYNFSLPASSRPGLGVVFSLIAVAALFAGIIWREMQFQTSRVRDSHVNEKMTPANAKDLKMRISTMQQPAAKQPATADAASSAVSIDFAPDDLMLNSKPASDAASAIADNKTVSKITGVRHWSSSAGSTVVIDMDDEVPYEVHRLASPERIYFDLHSTALSEELEGKTFDIGDASLTRVRIGQPVAGVTRVVLDTKDGANFSVSMESSPYRLVVELRGSEKAMAAYSTPSTHTITSQPATPAETNPSPAKIASASPAAPRPPEQPALGKSSKFRIVLDAGHGGWDLGTVGRHGLLEKDLVLDVTERLGKLLQSRLGSEVMFTRTDDTYLPLDQRSDIANQAQADLFVSIHANYSTSASARGIETYYTNLFSAPGTREAEKHEDGSFTNLTPVSLSAEGLHDKIEESRRLASSVQRSLVATLTSNNPDIRNRGIKDAAFAVLTGTTMPSILTEISFVSSPADEHNLQSAAYRQQIAEALYQGIARYQQSAAHVKVAQLQTAASQRSGR